MAVPVADRDRFDPVFFGDRVQELRGFELLAGALLRIDDIVEEEFPLASHDRDLAARAESGIDRHRGLPAQRGREEKLPQVLGKNPDRLLVGFLFEKHPGLGLHRESEQALVGILDGQPDLRRCGRFSRDELRDQDRDRLVLGRSQARKQKTLRLAPADRQDPVGRRAGGGSLQSK